MILPSRADDLRRVSTKDCMLDAQRFARQKFHRITFPLHNTTRFLPRRYIDIFPREWVLWIPGVGFYDGEWPVDEIFVLVVRSVR